MSVEESVKEIFSSCGSANMADLSDQLKSLYKSSTHQDFTSQFLDILEYPLVLRGEGEQTAIRILKLTAKFALQLNLEYRQKQLKKNSEVEDLHPFLSDLLNFLLETQRATSYNVRLHSCHLFALILSELDEMVCSNEMYLKLIRMAEERLKDKSSCVRAQAVFAASPLQDPTDESCVVVKTLLFLFKHDPYHIVRRNAVKTIVVNKQTISAVTDGIRDVDSSVRKTAVLRISRKISYQCYNVSQRIKILQSCLYDKSDTVKKAFQTNLLPMWLKTCGNMFIKFLQSLDSALKDFPELLQDCLNLLFELQDMKTVAKELELDAKSHTPSETLTVEMAFLWRCVCQFLKTLNMNVSSDLFDEITPTASEMCKLLENIVASFEQADDSLLSDKLFIIEQLIALSHDLDFTDTYGREAMYALLFSFLKTSWCSHNLVKSIINCLQKMKLRADIFLKDIMDTIKIITPNEDDKENCSTKETLLKCLTILSVLLADFEKNYDQADFLEFVTEYALSCMANESREVRNATFLVIGLYCLLSVERAQEYYLLLLHASYIDHELIRVTALKAVFDILLSFGPELFHEEKDGVDENRSVNVVEEEEKFFSLVIEKITPGLDSQSEEIRAVVAEGIGKLMLCGYIFSSQLFARLLLLKFSPSTEDEHQLRCFLEVFIPEYIYSENTKLECLEEGFIIALETLFDAPSTNILSTVDPLEVASFFLNLSSPSAFIAKGKGANKVDIHSKLGFAIGEKIADDPRSNHTITLVKILNALELNNISDSKDIASLVFEVLQEMTDKAAVRGLKTFLSKSKYSHEKQSFADNDENGICDEGSDNEEKDIANAVHQ